MKICITGAAGFLGSHLVESFVSKGHNVIGVDNMVGGDVDNIIEHELHEFIEGDVTDLELMSSVLDGCDVVYHCAAYAYEGLSVFSPALVTNNIVTGTTVVATAAIRNSVKRFINTSSMARYGMNIVPFVETMAPQPEDPYGVAKYAAEMQLNLLSNVHGFDLVHAIPHNIVGPRQKSNDPFRNVASIMINLMLCDRQPIIYGDGSQVRCFSFIDDDIYVLEKLLDCDLHERGELFNIGPDEEFITINELAMRLAAIMDFELKADYHDMRPCEVYVAYCSADKIRERFGYETKMTLDEGLKEMVDFLVKKGHKPFEYHLPIEIMNDRLPKTWNDRLF